MVVSAALFHVCVDGSGSGRILLQRYNVARTAMPYHEYFSHLISRTYQEQDVSCHTRPQPFDRTASNPLSFAYSTARPTPYTPFCPAPKPGRDSGYPTNFGPRTTCWWDHGRSSCRPPVPAASLHYCVCHVSSPAQVPLSYGSIHCSSFSPATLGHKLALNRHPWFLALLRCTCWDRQHTLHTSYKRAPDGMNAGATERVR